MHRRGARLAVVALLVAVGGVTAFLLWEIDRRMRALDERTRDVAAQVDVTVSALNDIGLAQHGYVAVQDSSGPASTIVAERVAEFQSAATRLGTLTRSETAPRLLQSIAREMAELTELDGRAQEYARSGQTFLASDLLSGPVREQLARIASHLGELRAAEAAGAEMEWAAVRDEIASALAAAAAVWLVGLLLLAWTGGRRVDPPAARSTASQVDPGTVASPPAEAPAARPAVDLASAAALCTDLSRVVTAAALPALLARAAGILDAQGLVVWMGAGDELFPAAAHGYDPRIVARLAPIGRSTVNATATAWRTGRVGTVRSDGDTPGAIVAPMFGPSHCIGVLAAEVRHAREQDAATRAVTAMIAAQLATIVAAWPAPSTTGADTPALDRAATGRA